MKGSVENVGGRVRGAEEEVESDRNQQPFDEERFRQIYLYDSPPKQTIVGRLKQIRCSSGFLFNLFPILQWLPKYKKRDLSSDIIAGLTVAVMHIPQGMAYALLGGVPTVVGIYMAVFPVLVYILMGTSRHVSMGTFAVVCMMVGKSVDTYSHRVDRNSTEITQQDVYEPPTPVEVAAAVCFIVGIWQVVFSVLKLGCLSVLLSQTLVSGFTTGAAVHVFTSQIKNLLGIEVKRYSGPFKIIYSYVDIFRNISTLNMPATVLSASSISFLLIFGELIKPCIQKKLKKAIPIPVEFLMVVIGTLLSQTLKIKEKFGVEIVDFVPTGLPSPSVPPMHFLSGLLTDGLVIAVVAVSINISMASIFAQKLGYEIDGNQELLASGVGNVFSSFFSCMPFAASLSRSLIQQTAGGKTQLASVVSCIALVLILLFIGPFFEPLPYCVLSSIIIVALKGMFAQLGELPEIWRNSKLDGLVWVCTFAGTVLLDIDYGLCIGLMTSIGCLLLRCQKTEIITLARLPNTEIYVDANRYKKAQPLSKVLILRLVGGVHFANAAAVRKKVTKLFFNFHRELFDENLNVEKQANGLCLIIDFSCVPFVDPSAVKSLRTVCDDVRVLKSSVVFCGCTSSVYDSLNGGEGTQLLVFHGIHDAVEHVNKSERGSEYLSRF